MEAYGSCTASERTSDDINVTGTWPHIEEPSTIDARVKPALVSRRGFVCNNCLTIASGWVCGDENEGGE